MDGSNDGKSVLLELEAMRQSKFYETIILTIHFIEMIYHSQVPNENEILIIIMIYYDMINFLNIECVATPGY